MDSRAVNGIFTDNYPMIIFGICAIRFRIKT